MKTKLICLLTGLYVFMYSSLKAEFALVEIGTIAKTAYDVIEGKVIKVECIWDDHDEAIYTHVIVEILTSYKGKLKGKIELQDIGGKIGNYKTVFPCQAEYKIGEEVIICVAKNFNVLQTHCGNQGKFNIYYANNNKKMVKRYVDFSQLLKPREINENMLRKEFDYDEFLLIMQDKQ